MPCDVLIQEKETRLWLINISFICNTKKFKFNKVYNRKSNGSVFGNDSRCKKASDFFMKGF